MYRTYNKYVEAKMIDLASGDFIEGNTDLFDERRNSRDVTKSVNLKMMLPVLTSLKHCCCLFR